MDNPETHIALNKQTETHVALKTQRTKTWIIQRHT